MFNKHLKNGWLRKVTTSSLTATFALSSFSSCTGYSHHNSQNPEPYFSEQEIKVKKSIVDAIIEWFEKTPDFFA